MLALKTLAVARRAGQDADLRRGRRRHRRRSGRRGRARGCRRSAERVQVLCITHLPQIAAYGHDATSRSPRRSAAAGRSTGVDAARRRRPRAGDGADDRRRRRLRDRARRRPRDARTRDEAAAQSESEVESESVSVAKAKAKAKGESESERGAEVPHRDVRLPDELSTTPSGWPGCSKRRATSRTADDRDADVVVINTCSVRERAEEKLYTRLGEIRDAGAGRGRHARSSPSPAASRSRKATQLLKRVQPIDVVVGTQSLKQLPMLVDARARRRASTRGPQRRHQPATTTSRSRWASPAAPIPSGPGSRSSRAATSSAPSASCRTRAATSGCGRSPTSSPRSAHAADTGATRDPAPRPDRQSLPGAGRSALRLRGAARARATTVPGIERIRFASPHPRHVTPRLIEAMRDLPKVCQHLHLPVQSGSTASSRRCAAATRARTTSSWSARLREADAGHRALDRHDRRLPGRDAPRTSTRRCR